MDNQIKLSRNKFIASTIILACQVVFSILLIIAIVISQSVLTTNIENSAADALVYILFFLLIIGSMWYVWLLAIVNIILSVINLNISNKGRENGGGIGRTFSIYKIVNVILLLTNSVGFLWSVILPILFMFRVI